MALVALVAIVAGTQFAYSWWQHRPWTRQLTPNQLRPGDCLTGSNLGLGSQSAWPYTVTAVPCTQRHLAEVFYARNIWPASLAKYPGDNTISSVVDETCQSALTAYDGAASSASQITFDSVAPMPASEWATGNRLVVCVAYAPGEWLSHSIKGKLP